MKCCQYRRNPWGLLSLKPKLFFEGYSRMAVTGPKTLTSSRTEQFQRLFWNWCLHSSKACWAPRATEPIWSVYSWQMRPWPGLSPGREWQLGGSSFCDTSPGTRPIRLKRELKSVNGDVTRNHRRGHEILLEVSYSNGNQRVLGFSFLVLPVY